jgi:hypothetical protein
MIFTYSDHTPWRTSKTSNQRPHRSPVATLLPSAVLKAGNDIAAVDLQANNNGILSFVS